MSMTKEQQQALDDALVPREQCLTIGSCNYRLSTTFKPKEPTFQVAFDVLSLTPFYLAFLITASVPAVYMQEFWAIVTYQKHHIRFKMNKKSYSFDMETFRNMLLICPKLPGQKFVDPPFKEEILTFIRELGYLATSNYSLMSKLIRYLNLENFGPSSTSVIVEKVDYVYLLWEDLVFQIENKESMKEKYMIILQDSQKLSSSLHHKVVQRYGAILPDYLTNPAMKESEAYKTYHDLATGKVQPKPKYVRRSSRTKSDEAPKPSSSKRVKTTAKVAKSGKKKQPALGLETLSDIALTEAEQMKLAIERSKTQLHISQPSSSGAHEGTGVTPGVLDVPTFESDDEQISWKSSEEEDDDEENVSEHKDDNDDERTKSNNYGDDFVHPKFSTHDDEAKQDEEVNEEDSFDPRVQTPSHVESTNDEDSDDVIQDANVEGDMINEENTHEEVEANETEDTHVILTAPINPEGQQQSSSVSSGFISNMLNPRPDTGIDSIFNLNTEATSLVDVLITIIAEPPLVFATTLLPPPLLLSHICNKHQLKTLETEFSEFKQRNQFAETVSSIPGIVDAYLAYKMNEAVKTTVQLQSDRLRDEAQAENEDFLNKLDDNIKKIIKDQDKEQVKAQVSKILPRIEKTVNEQLEAEVMTRSYNESKTSHAVAANLSELELKKILIDKMERNKSIHRLNEQKNLYNALVEAYESDKLILETYGETVSFKRCRDEEDKDEEPFAGSNRGSKRRRAGKEPESTKEPMHTDKDLEEPAHQEFDIAKPPTPDRDWNKTLPAVHGSVQPWLSNSAWEEGPRESFDELMDTLLDFSAFMIDWIGTTLKRIYLVGSQVVLIQLPLQRPRLQIMVPNTMWSEVPVNYDKHVLWGISHWGRKHQQFYEFAANRESACDVYSKHRIIAVIKLQIVKWHGYKHLDWITIRRDDDKLYTFKEG
ncbi:hypothetical protein Tco_1260799, partial [Tanacetum coccineum]